MRHPGRKPHLGLVVALLLLALLAAATAAALARSPDQNYDLSWHTVDGGGYTWSTGGAGPPGRLYTLGGTIGQPDAGLLAGGSYELGGGFWAGGALTGFLYAIYLPLAFK